MKLVLMTLEGKVPPWVEQGREAYREKLGAFAPFEILNLKSPSADRDSAAVKTRKEAELLLSRLDDRDFVVLFDEGGKLAKSSEDFATVLGRVLESGKGRAVFIIGGAYGFDDKMRERAQARWSLSPLTMNHWVASVAALEQLYRGFTILKGIPYHNR